MIDLFEHQIAAVEKLCSGKILVGKVGAGKSRAGLYYYSEKELPKEVVIITTARKRDTHEWEKEITPFGFPIDISITIDSWNNIGKYAHIKDAFFIFDEQRVIGSGAWVKSFLRIAKSNHWILLSATPGDTWSDYIPVFVANGWYKNRTEFIRRHVVYNNFSKFPKIDHYVEVSRLVRLRDAVIVNMHYEKRTITHDEDIQTPYDKTLFDRAMIGRWNVYENRPIKDVGELCYVMRRVVNSDPRRIDILHMLLEAHPKVIVFYNFNYERDLLLDLGERLGLPTAEWNGHNHQPIPDTNQWMYIVQYAAGAEGWNCIETDTIIFYSQNYSYKATIQAAGRIDRVNTPFSDLYYYYLRSNSIIDLAIQKAFNSKKDFNEHRFMSI